MYPVVVHEWIMYFPSIYTTGLGVITWKTSCNSQNATAYIYAKNIYRVIVLKKENANK